MMNPRLVKLGAVLVLVVLLSSCGAIARANPQLMNDRVQSILDSSLESQDKLTALNSLFEREGDQGDNFLTAWRELLQLVTAITVGVSVVAK